MVVPLQILHLCTPFRHQGVVVVVIVWLLFLNLPVQSVPIITKVMSSNSVQGEVYNIIM